ncbi:hypothetical protein HK096_006283, partial [Nowakowskiella sp. JEL0078]
MVVVVHASLPNDGIFFAGEKFTCTLTFLNLPAHSFSQQNNLNSGLNTSNQSSYPSITPLNSQLGSLFNLTTNETPRKLSQPGSVKSVSGPFQNSAATLPPTDPSVPAKVIRRNMDSTRTSVERNQAGVNKNDELLSIQISNSHISKNSQKRGTGLPLSPPPNQSHQRSRSATYSRNEVIIESIDQTRSVHSTGEMTPSIAKTIESIIPNSTSSINSIQSAIEWITGLKLDETSESSKPKSPLKIPDRLKLIASINNSANGTENILELKPSSPNNELPPLTTGSSGSAASSPIKANMKGSMNELWNGTPHISSQVEMPVLQNNEKKQSDEEISWAFAQMTGNFSIDGSFIKASAFEPLKNKVMYRSANMSGSGGFGGGGSLGITSEGAGNQVSDTRNLPIFSTPPTILFVDLKIPEGESCS